MGEQGFHICALCIPMHLFNCAQILGSFSVCYLKHSSIRIIISCCSHLDSLLFSIGLPDLVIAYIICWCFFYFISFGNLWVLDIVLLSPKYSSLDMCECTPMGIYHYIGLLELVTHFGNRCQWGRSFRGFKGNGLCFEFVS